MKFIPNAAVRPAAAHALGRGSALAAMLVTVLGVACAPRGGAPVPALPGSLSAPTSQAADYEGTWTGIWVREKCSETGGAMGVACQRLPLRDELRLRLERRGARMEGTLEFTGLRADISGTAHPEGTLVLKGTTSAAAHSTTVTEWRSSLADANRELMTGSFTFSIAPDDEALGTVTVSATIEELVKEKGERPVSR
jgi:hypothetical protein